MNRFNDQFDKTMAQALRARAIARSIAGGLVIVGILVVAGAHQPSNDLPDAASSQPAPPPADTSLDSELRLDPSEIMLYSSNVHG